MSRGISGETQTELLRLLRDRYKGSSKSDKTKILDEFVAVSGFHRKHAIRLLTGPPPTEQSSHLSRRVYDEAVQQVLIVAWEASDRICSKRLKPVLPSIVEAMERHGHLDVEQIVRDKVLVVSAATIDRLLKPVRIKAKRRRSKCKNKVSKQVPTKTFSDWNEPEATAKQLFQRLQILHPGVFNGQLRTLQRRIKDWRAVMAKQLVFGALRDDNGSAEITPIGMMSQEQMDTDH